MQVRFQDFSTYHGKNPPTGSTHIRVHQLVKYWPEAAIYRYGESPEVLIFQKVYCTPDYKFPKSYPGLKILDICDADWLNGLTGIKETVDAMDAITCSSDGLTEFIKQLTDKPVITIPDRFDIEVIPKPQHHMGDAKTVVWFGYRHNAVALHGAMNAINELGLNLIVISDDDPIAWQWLPKLTADEFRKDKYEFVKYEEETIYAELQKAEICVLPDALRPLDRFKSNNKTIKAILAGLPVAKDSDQLRLFIKAENRQKYMDDLYQKTLQEYDIKRSVEQYRKLIATINR